jgi:BRCA1-associated protein
MDLTTQRIWDYASDGYVHRIVQSKSDGKLVQLPPNTTPNHSALGSRDDDFDDYVPREKLDNIGQEYTHLLTSQLDSQRMYFEEILERAADKASRASQAAEKATALAESTSHDLIRLRTEHETLAKDTLPQLERDRDRATRRADKFEGMAHKLEKEWREEKTMNASLMERITHLGSQVESLRTEKTELEEQNRDLGFFISGGQKLQEVGGEEVREGVVSVGDAPVAGGGRGKRKGRK